MQISMLMKLSKVKQGSHRSMKFFYFIKVRERSGNFEFDIKVMEKSGNFDV